MTIDRDKLIIEHYQSGLSLVATGKKVGVGGTTVTRVLKKHGVDLRTMKGAWKNRGTNDIDAQKVIAEYKAGESILKLSKQYDVSRNKISLCLTEAGVELRTLAEQRNNRPLVNVDHLLLNGDYSIKSIMKTHNVGKSTAVRFRDESEVTTHAGHLDIDTDVLIDQHVNQGINVYALSRIYNCDCVPLIKRLGAHYTPDTNKSGLNDAVGEFLQSLNVAFIENTRKIIAPLELDFYFPGKKIAIEMNGIYWHTEVSGRKNRTYHLNKLKLCQAQNIDLVSFTDEDWYANPEICKSMIRHRLGLSETSVYARSCKRVTVDNTVGKKFFIDNHISGHARAAFYIGLEYKDELVACVSLGTPRFDKSADYELIRFATKTNTVVVGGFSKMLKGVDGSVMTFSDKMYGTGGVYAKAGFKWIGSTPCGYRYTKQNKTYNRMQFQKHKLPQKLKTFNPDLTEWKNMQLNGYDRIWDCGHLKWIKDS